MKEAEAQFPLTLEFAASAEKPTQDASAPYVSDASSRSAMRKGDDVLSARSDGPILLVRLPSGSYTVEAEWNGVRKQRAVPSQTTSGSTWYSISSASRCRRSESGNALSRRRGESRYPPMCTWYCAPVDRLHVPVPWYGVVMR